MIRLPGPDLFEKAKSVWLNICQNCQPLFKKRVDNFDKTLYNPNHKIHPPGLVNASFVRCNFLYIFKALYGIISL